MNTMNENEFVEHIVNQIINYSKENSITDFYDLSSFSRNFFDSLSQTILENQDIDKIEIKSPNVVLEMIDKSNGQLHRRYLELSYHENINGIRIQGESIDGKESEIAFLSDSAISKISELKGDGLDSPRCH